MTSWIGWDLQRRKGLHSESTCGQSARALSICWVDNAVWVTLTSIRDPNPVPACFGDTVSAAPGLNLLVNSVGRSTDKSGASTDANLSQSDDWTTVVSSEEAGAAKVQSDSVTSSSSPPVPAGFLLDMRSFQPAPATTAPMRFELFKPLDEITNVQLIDCDLKAFSFSRQGFFFFFAAGRPACRAVTGIYESFVSWQRH